MALLRPLLRRRFSCRLFCAVPGVLTAKLASIGATFVGRHTLKFFSQRLALIREKGLEPSPGILHRLTLLGRQLLKMLIPLTELLLLLRRKRPPLLEALFRLLTLLRRHGPPLLGAIA